MMWWIAGFIGLVVVFAISCGVILTLHQRWHFKETGGDRYFARTLAERRALKKEIQNKSKLLLPLADIVARGINMKMLPTFFVEGDNGKKIAGPAALASEDSFVRCKNYQPTEKDIFVATQMKCGTTWMQQIVFQVLTHGEGEFNDGEYRHLYAISPWIEMDPKGSVPLENAPYVSRYHKKIIKTHMPVELCPINDKAKYIYVTRHPASCFASMEDFVGMLTGPMCPSHENLLTFFNSENMWWGPWIHHTENWWEESQQRDNVLFVVFEELKKNTVDIVQRVAKFLEVELTTAELEKVLHKIDFSYMKENAEYFEMAPPNIFSESSQEGFFVKGSNSRHEDLSDEQRNDIIAYCKQELKNKEAAWLDFYPELKS